VHLGAHLTSQQISQVSLSILHFVVPLGFLDIKKFCNFYIPDLIRMAVFQTKTFLKYDDYMTPKSAWENIKHLIPKDKMIWEAFYGDGKSGDYLKELGFNVIHDQINFFENDLGDIIVSNPPFTIVKEVLLRLKELDKPFIIIMPVSKLNTSYFRENFMNKIQIIIPPKRIHFDKLVDNEKPKDFKSSCNFDCFYYCYKMGFEKDIIWLE